MSRRPNSGVQPETRLGASSTESGGSSNLSRDQIFEILSNQRRRWVLHVLKQRDSDGTEIRELSTRIAAWETEKSTDLVTSAERKRVYTSLHQFHLPKMSKNRIIEYDPQGGIVELSSQATDLEVYLDVVREDTVPWSLYYGGVSVISGLLLGAAWFDLPPFGLLPDIAWAVVCIGVIMISAAVHHYYHHRLRLGQEGSPPGLDN
jgi:hypothetical protein